MESFSPPAAAETRSNAREPRANSGGSIQRRCPPDRNTPSPSATRRSPSHPAPWSPRRRARRDRHLSHTLLPVGRQPRSGRRVRHPGRRRTRVRRPAVAVDPLVPCGRHRHGAGPTAANVAVRLLPAASDEAGEPMDVAVTLTNREGGFTFPAGPPGQYQLSVLRPPPEPIDLDDSARIRVTLGGDVTIGSAVRPATPPPPPPVPADATLYAQMALAVGDTALTDVVVPLAAAPRIAGRVEFDGTSDRPAGSVVSGIRIDFDPADGSRLTDTSVATQAGHPDEDGQFRTFGVPPGRYVLRVNPPSGWALKSATAGGTDISEFPLPSLPKTSPTSSSPLPIGPPACRASYETGRTRIPTQSSCSSPSNPRRGQGGAPIHAECARRERTRTGPTPSAGSPRRVLHRRRPRGVLRRLADSRAARGIDPIARQVRVLDGDRRTQDLTPAVIRLPFAGWCSCGSCSAPPPRPRRHATLVPSHAPQRRSLGPSSATISIRSRFVTFASRAPGRSLRQPRSPMTAAVSPSPA